MQSSGKTSTIEFRSARNLLYEGKNRHHTQQHSQRQFSSSLAHSPTGTSISAGGMTVPTVVAAQGDRGPDLSRPYKCRLCDKAFRRLEHQTRHVLMHTGEKPHVCRFPGCNKRFSRSDELIRHSRIHSKPAALAAQDVCDSQSSQQPHRINRMHQIGRVPQRGQWEHVGQQMDERPQMNTLGQQGSHTTSIVRLPAPQQQLSLQTRRYLSTPLPSQTQQPPPRATRAASASQLSTTCLYPTCNINGSTSLAAETGSRARSNGWRDTSLLAPAAPQAERGSNTHLLNQHLPLPSRTTYSAHPYHHSYHTVRMPSLSSLNYSLNLISHMARLHAHEDGENPPHKNSGSHIRTALPSPSFSQAFASPMPCHTTMATPTQWPRLRLQFYHHEVQLPSLHYPIVAHQPPPHLAPIEPPVDDLRPYFAM